MSLPPPPPSLPYIPFFRFWSRTKIGRGESYLARDRDPRRAFPFLSRNFPVFPVQSRARYVALQMVKV